MVQGVGLGPSLPHGVLLMIQTFSAQVGLENGGANNADGENM